MEPIRRVNVRLTESEYMRLRRAALERKVTLQTAILQALEGWYRQQDPRQRAWEELKKLRGIAAGTSILDDHEREHREEIERDDQNP
jgi:hypothetical protein